MILIVEDEPYIGQNIGYLCEGLNVQPIVVQTGAEALKLIKTVSLRLAIIDLRLPDISGLSLIKAIRRLPDPIGTTPILVETGDSHRAISTALMAGANEAVEKPYSLDLLRLKIVSLMRAEQEG